MNFGHLLGLLRLITFVSRGRRYSPISSEQTATQQTVAPPLGESGGIARHETHKFEENK